MTPETTGRTYELLGLVGKGGFGRVYKARLATGDFTKVVAIKVLNDAAPAQDVLDRFRDEARILGMLRDRAIVHIDQPALLDGKWAVVMEYLDGTSVHQLLRRGPIPPRASLLIVAEVARALQRAWDAPGPDGRPLRLVHRDLKPANLQLTPDGEVKILDFGIAKAVFEDRASSTTSHIAGSPGYIAPERFAGVDGQPADVWSLGVVLRGLLTGQKPSTTAPERPALEDPAEIPIWDAAALLHARMVAPDPEARPTMGEVSEQCRLLAAAAPGQDLHAWARAHVPEIVPSNDDPLLGSVLSETQNSVRSATAPLVAAVGASVALTGLALSLGAVLVAVVAGAWWWSRPPGGESDAAGVAGVPPARVEPVEVVAPATPIPEAPAVEVPVVEPPVLEPPVPAPVPAPAGRAPRPAAAVPARVEPAPAPAVASSEAEHLSVVITSIPPDASVWIDGVASGTTPLFGLALTGGTHVVRLAIGDRRLERTITVGRRAPTRYVWKLEEDQWLSGY